MCRKSFAFSCFKLFLLFISSSKSQQNITNKVRNNNLTVQYEGDTKPTTIYRGEIKTLRYDLYEKFTNDMQYEMQNKFRTISMNNEHENVNSKQYKLDTRSIHNHEDDEQISLKSHMNSTNVNYKKNFTSHVIYENLIEKNDSMLNKIFKNSSRYNNKGNIVPYETCHNDTCILLCCPLGNRLIDNKCIPEEFKYLLPNVYMNNSLQSNSKRVDELFQLSIHDSCLEKNHSVLPEDYQYDYMIFVNGSIYLSYYKIFLKSTSYCLAVMKRDKFEVIICSETLDENDKAVIFQTDNASLNFDAVIHASSHLVTILFLMPIFLVYSILPELRNVHGFILRNYSSTLSVAYTLRIVTIIIKTNDIQYPVCLTIAFFNYFCFLSGYFWLTAISFDMWWTFRGSYSLQRQEKRKSLYYAIYAWGCPFIFATVSVIMDSVSNYMPQILRPEFQLGRCWFHDKKVFALYFYGFKSACIISSIFLSISTALKIKHYEKNTNRHLTNSGIKRYNNNKKWLNLYLKLFVVLFVMMGIKWSVMTVTWLFGEVPNYVKNITNLAVILQNLCAFIIFVCKRKIKVLLLKRFGCGLFSQVQGRTNATWSLYTTIFMQESMRERNSFKKENCQRANDSFDETEL